MKLAVGRVAPPATAAPRPRRPRPRALVLAAFLVAVVVAATPQGRDAVSEAAQLVGIGEVGGPPTKESEVGQFKPASDQLVLATGTTADQVRFEIVAYRSDERIRGAEDATVCVNTEFPSAESDGPGGCSAGALRSGGLCCPQVVMKDAATSVPYIEGQVSPEVEAVSVSYTDEAGQLRQIQATVGVITRDFAAALDVEHRSGLFMASLPGLWQDTPPGFAPGPAEPIEVTGFRADGEVVETETYPAVRDLDATTEMTPGLD